MNKISLIIPVYNMERYLRQCLDSAVGQTYQDCEIVVVDDGSVDCSYAICQEYQKLYKNLILIHKENEGLAATWQRGLKECTGDFVTFLDSDDWIEPDYIERLASGMEQGADIVCCNKVLEYSSYRVLLREGIPAGIYLHEDMLSQVFPVMLNDGTYLGRRITAHRCGKLFRKELIEANLFYCDSSISYGEDLNIVFPALIDCRTLVVLEDNSGLYHYRQNEMSILRSYKQRMFPQIDRLYEQMLKVNSDKNVYDFLPQIQADYLCLFFEYVKNETRCSEKTGTVVSRVLKNYQHLKSQIAGEKTPVIELKLSDKLLLKALEHDSHAGTALWFVLYDMTKRQLKGADWKFRRERRKNAGWNRILMVGPHESVKGGIRTVVDNYLSWEQWKKTEIIYVPTFIEKNNLYKIAFFLFHYMQIIWICCTKKIDIVHLHVAERGSFYRKALVLLLCRRMGIRTVLHHHGAEFIPFYEKSGHKAKQFIERTVYLADLNLVLSEYQKNEMEKLFPYAAFQVIYNTVPEYGKNQYNPKATGILFVGRLGERKGIYDVLQAFKNCEQFLDKNVKLYLCGDGDIKKVKERIRTLRLQNRIAHIGWCSKEKLKKYYQNAMFYILPSYHEGLPMALLEAMSYGIPCIGSRVAAIPEVLEDRKSGMLVTPGDIEGIRKAMLYLIQNQDVRCSMGECGYQVIRNRFLIEQGIEELEKIYDSIKASDKL